MTPLQNLAQQVKTACRVLATAETLLKNDALFAIAAALTAHERDILAANQLDVERARDQGMTPSLLDRLTLTHQRIADMATGVRQVAALPDPIGTVTSMAKRPNGLIIGRRTVPLGVIGIIYEARPNVTVDAGVLCLKSGNGVLLRGGKEAINSNQILTKIMQESLVSVGLPAHCIALVGDTSRSSAVEMMGLSGYLDVLIPRGGAQLIRTVVEQARVPVIETGVGVCHVYVHSQANLNMAVNIIVNAKCSRPSVCNAAETLLVDEAIAPQFLPMAQAAMPQVEFRGDEKVQAILEGVTPATVADWDTEFGDYILAVKVVSGFDQAVDFIAHHTTGHSECIVTDCYPTAQRFLDVVDAAAVYVNASTRFTDGAEFGLGAEIGISTQKIHARGPMGLEQLTSGKFVVYGNGQVR